MRKMYGLRQPGTDLWVTRFCFNIGDEYNNVEFGPFEKAKTYSKKHTAQGLATKANKQLKKYGTTIEVVEFDLVEVKNKPLPAGWEEFKKYVDEEIQKVKPLFPNYPPYIPTSPCDGDKPSPWERRRKSYDLPDIWCGRKPQNEPIMMNTPENPSLMIVSATGE